MKGLYALWHSMTKALPLVNWSTADLLVRGTLLLIATLGIRYLLRNRSAAVRHFVGLLGVLALLLLPITLTVLPAGMGLLPSLTSTPPASATGVRASGLTATAWLAILWALGTTLVLARLLADRAFLARAFERATATPQQAAALQTAALAHGLTTPLAVRTSDEVDVPLAFGMKQPSILLPADAPQWPAERLELVLLHEAAHLRRLDQVTQTLSLMVTALYWFHPLAWLGSRHLALDREHACDDLVLRARGDATMYARQLVAIAEALAGKRSPTLAVSMARPSQLRQRLTAVLDASRDRRTLRRRDTALGLTIAVLMFASVGARGGVGRQVTERPLPSSDEFERESSHDGSIRETVQQEPKEEGFGHHGGGHPSGYHPSGHELEFSPAIEQEQGFGESGHGGRPDRERPETEAADREETWQ